MDKEMDKYRARLEQKWNRRTSTRVNGGRRIADSKPPKFWTWDFTIQVVALVTGGVVALILAGCTAIKKVLGG